ncbi:MAG: dihydrolipoyl dehydrogenase [Lachnospiraceae bacterium]|nr:dihydrolipoyl dehydrogenase [Lachnospiraceae bacterium]
MSEIFDVLIIGGGPGGYRAAERAAEGGLKTVIFEENKFGGTCLNEGCIPTKTLLNSAKLVRHAQESEAFGVKSESVQYDHAAVIARKDKVVKTLVRGVEVAMRHENIKVVRGKAEIEGRNDSGFTVTAAGESYTGRNLIIASGSKTAIPPVPGLKEGLESGFVITSREALEEKDLPKQLAVIGGGVIGLELACFYASVGTAVTVIEMLPKIAGNTDPDICAQLMKIYGKRGMRFALSSRVLEVTKDSLVFEKDGQKETLACDKVLLSAGRIPSTAIPGLEKLGAEMNRAAIVTDRHLETSVPGLYAVGDCNGKLMLAHTAYREAEVAVNHILGKADEIRYESIPSVIYTDPEVASVGESAESAKNKGISVKQVVLPLRFSGRYLAETERGEGFLKLLEDEDRKCIIGCHVIGPYASELIAGAALMIDSALPPERLVRTVFPHPTVGEVLRDALFQLI